MEEQKIKNLIKVWHEKARRERDVFSRFVFLWICFNAWLDFRSGKERDREMIEYLKEQKRDLPALDLISSFNYAFESKDTCKILHGIVSLSPIKDSRGKFPDVNITNTEDIPNIVEAIYRVRCNFFHGRKEAKNPRDEQLVTVCARILEKWIGNLIGGWK